MAFCRNCGSEVTEGTKFCSNCGTSIENRSGQTNVQPEKPVSMIDKLGKFYGIILMILSFVDFQIDPAFLKIVLSVAIIAGGIFCFSKKYKLKIFTIISLILAIICLLSGISQAKRIGLFKMPGKDKIAEDVIEMAPVVENKTEEENVAASKEEPVVEEPIVEEPIIEEPVVDETEEEVIKEEEIKEEASVIEEKGAINGVDPELKAFLDSYEAFMDEYVDFMKKYMADPGNAVVMFSEYTEIMKKYEDFADKIEKYDSEEMSTEDAKYYLEVINRCNKKMMELY